MQTYLDIWFCCFPLGPVVLMLTRVPPGAVTLPACILQPAFMPCTAVLRSADARALPQRISGRAVYRMRMPARRLHTALHAARAHASSFHCRRILSRTRCRRATAHRRCRAFAVAPRAFARAALPPRHCWRHTLHRAARCGASACRCHTTRRACHTRAATPRRAAPVPPRHAARALHAARGAPSRAPVRRTAHFAAARAPRVRARCRAPRACTHHTHATFLCCLPHWHYMPRPTHGLRVTRFLPQDAVLDNALTYNIARCCRFHSSSSMAAGFRVRALRASRNAL